MGDFSQPFSNLFLKILTEGAVTTEAGSLFQYFTTLTEKAQSLPRRWLAPWGIVPCRGALLGRVESEVHINNQKASEYLECVNQVKPWPSPLQGMKVQPL